MPLAACSNSSDDAAATTTTKGDVSLGDAVAIAQRSLDGAAVTKDQMKGLIVGLCADSLSGDPEESLNAASRLTVSDAAALRTVLTAAGKGAEARCPSDVGNHPQLVNDLYTAASAVLIPVTTSTSAAPTGTSAAPSSGGTTATTKAPVATTKATAPPTTHAPVTTAATTPPPPAASGPTYANCTAARNAGAAPLYRGDPGYRDALDRDHDGIACET
jgi:hypothetical protein